MGSNKKITRFLALLDVARVPSRHGSKGGVAVLGVRPRWVWRHLSFSLTDSSAKEGATPTRKQRDQMSWHHDACDPVRIPLLATPPLAAPVIPPSFLDFRPAFSFIASRQFASPNTLTSTCYPPSHESNSEDLGQRHLVFCPSVKKKNFQKKSTELGSQNFANGDCKLSTIC